MNKTVNGLWESFRNDVIPYDAPEDQLREMKRAFFAGAHSMFHLIGYVSDTQTEDEAMKMFDYFENEIMEFVSSQLK